MTHPMQPTNKQILEWFEQSSKAEGKNQMDMPAAHLARLAYAAGADAELKACCDHLRDFQWGVVDLPDGTKMHNAVFMEKSRRPTLTPQQQALDACATALAAGRLTPDEAGLIRCALEAQP